LTKDISVVAGVKGPAIFNKPLHFEGFDRPEEW